MKILFVCTGNICRSSSAEAIARHIAEERGLVGLEFDSAGTSDYHQGESSDFRAIDVARRNNVNFGDIRARKIELNDAEDFDYIFCMDRSHVKKVKDFIAEKFHSKVFLFLEFGSTVNSWDDEVVDPYYHHDKLFEEVFDKIYEGANNAIDRVIFEN